ncbi:MAG: hypothetical protein ACAF41_00515 (plasmid) [Leptolyngbya sp. BL-A-14]
MAVPLAVLICIPYTLHPTPHTLFQQAMLHSTEHGDLVPMVRLQR